MYVLVFYVPETHLEVVKNALFSKGAGKIGAYSHCCWQTLGTGQFKALEESTPFVGEKNEIEKIEEYRVEMVFDESLLSSILTTLKEVHPYETPAFHVLTSY